MGIASESTETALQNKRVLLILSQGAGGNVARRKFDPIVGFFDQNARKTETLAFSRAQTPVAALEIPERIKTGDIDTVVVCGGDGTIRAVAQELWQQQLSTPLGIVPTGSANMLARAVGVRLSIPQALEQLLHASPRQVAAGVLNEKHIFLVGVCFGLLAKITLAAESSGKDQLGWMAYAVTTFRHLWFTPRRDVTLRVDPPLPGGETVLAHSVLVLVEPSARLLIPPAQLPAEPLSVCWGDNLTIFGGLSLSRSWLVLRKPHRCVKVSGGQSVEVDGFRLDEMYIDGDYLNDIQPPFCIRPLPSGITMLV